MASVVDKQTREDILRMMIAQRRHEAFDELIGFGVFAMMAAMCGWAFINCF